MAINVNQRYYNQSQNLNRKPLGTRVPEMKISLFSISLHAQQRKAGCRIVCFNVIEFRKLDFV